MIKNLVPYIKGYGWRSFLASLTVVFEVLLEVYIPFLMADIIDIGLASNDVDFIIKRGLAMIGFACCSLLFGALSARLASVASTGFAKNIRQALFNKVQDFSFANIDRFTTASLITRLTTDVTNVQQSYMMVIRMLVRSPIMLIAATIMATRVNSGLSSIFLYALPLLIIAILIIAFKTFPLFKEMLEKYDSMNGEVQENLIGIRVVKAFVREKHETDAFIDSASLVRKAQIKAESILAWNMPFSQFVLYGCMIAVCYLGGQYIVAGDMETGELMSFISYIIQILTSLMMISMAFVLLVMTRASITRIVDVLKESPDISDSDANPELEPKDGSIVFKDVCFSYNRSAETPILDHVDLEIASGETVGIIGGTGSAKTTLVQLIPRLYDVVSGSVSIGGHDVREYKLDILRGSVSMVLQKNELFSGTIRDNLLWGKNDATDAEIESACMAAQAHEFITSFPNSYDTFLGQGGVNLSGGQKQRICIARALLRKPKVIIMDDSTSAVDTATDARIRASLPYATAKATTIIIAQRIASVIAADKIIVMNEGTICDIGTHSELLERSEIYREVYESQQKGVDAA